jgi:hypothetical protein
MAPSDFYLFRNLKSELLKTKFVNQSELEQLIISYFDLKSSQWFRRGFELFKDRLNHVISNKGEYFE